MTNKIGFYCDGKEINENTENTTVEKPEVKARKSLVSIRFEKNNRVLSYYNDKFDLHKGDIVFVDNGDGLYLVVIGHAEGCAVVVIAGFGRAVVVFKVLAVR